MKYPTFPFQGLPKYIKIGIFGLKPNDLAALDRKNKASRFMMKTNHENQKNGPVRLAPLRRAGLPDFP
jgi:hypothetical protein